MLQESRLGGHYISPRLTDQGKASWQSFLEEAIKQHNDDWLARELLSKGLLRTRETYTRKGIAHERDVNREHASQQLAEGEFNRYYLRGLCLRAKAEKKNALVIYRGKQVAHPRSESEQKIGTSIAV